MRNLKFIIIALFAVVVGLSSCNQVQAQSLKTETIKVSGNCGMCKTRIEKAAKLDGVSKADWNSDTKILTVTYNPSKVKNEDIQKKIAAVGHDTEKFKAEDEVYNKLHSCCKYR